jgi:thiol-disulfide isomerase/thioredoxin
MNALRRTVLAFLVASAFCVGRGPAPAAAADRLQPWTGATPPLELKDLAGEVHTLARYRGRVVLVNFWATWCEPCREEMPSMQRLQERLAGQPFTVLAVNYGESAARIQAFLERVPLRFPVLLDRNQEASRAWRVRFLPVSFLVGPDGAIRHHVVGELDWASAAAVDAVRALLPAPAR